MLTAKNKINVIYYFAISFFLSHSSITFASQTAIQRALTSSLKACDLQGAKEAIALGASLNNRSNTKESSQPSAHLDSCIIKYGFDKLPEALSFLDANGGNSHNHQLIVSTYFNVMRANAEYGFNGYSNRGKEQARNLLITYFEKLISLGFTVGKFESTNFERKFSLIATLLNDGAPLEHIRWAISQGASFTAGDTSPLDVLFGLQLNNYNAAEMTQIILLLIEEMGVAFDYKGKPILFYINESGVALNRSRLINNRDYQDTIFVNVLKKLHTEGVPLNLKYEGKDLLTRAKIYELTKDSLASFNRKKTVEFLSGIR